MFRKALQKPLIRTLLWIAIVLWAAFILKLAVFRFFPIEFTFSPNRSYNLVPLKSIFQYLLDYKMNDTIRIINLLGNVGVFIPFGLTGPVLWRKVSPYKAALVISAGFSMLIEVLQFMTGQGVADIDDLLLNVLGGFLGCTIYKLLASIIVDTDVAEGNDLQDTSE